MKILHTGDLHFSVKPDKLAETIRTTDYILATLETSPVDVAIVAGDSVDEYDGPIRLDSPTARAAISFVRRLAEHCPVLIIRGTHSHDKEAPYIFREIRARYPIYVGTELEMVGLYQGPKHRAWHPIGSRDFPLVAAFTLLPSVDKAALYAHVDGSIRQGNAEARVLIHDVLAGFGQVNASLACPRILVAHGMCTGAQFSTGQIAVGEDLEFGVQDLLAAGCDYVALAHVHKHQVLHSRVAYCGSPGALNYGEKELKGFIRADIGDGFAPDGLHELSLSFVLTPARTFAFVEHKWNDRGAEGVRGAVAMLAEGAKGAHVRVRYDIPEEEAHSVRREELEAMLRAAGAEQVKVEVTIIPKVRTRAKDISRLSSIAAKVERWGECVDQDVSGILDLAGQVEGKTVEELAEEALARLAVPMGVDTPADAFSFDRKEAA